MKRVNNNNCTHDKIYKNGKSRGRQRYVCAKCGQRIWELSEMNKKIFKENIDLLLCQKDEIVREDFIIPVGEDENEIYYPYKYHLKTKTLDWKTFLKYKRQCKIKGELLIYYLSDNINYVANLNMVRIEC